MLADFVLKRPVYGNHMKKLNTCENHSSFNDFTPLETINWAYVFVFADYLDCFFFSARSFIHLSQICFSSSKSKSGYMYSAGFLKVLDPPLLFAQGVFPILFFFFLLSSPFPPSHQRRLKSSFSIWRLKLEKKSYL